MKILNYNPHFAYLPVYIFTGTKILAPGVEKESPDRSPKFSKVVQPSCFSKHSPLLKDVKTCPRQLVGHKSPSHLSNRVAARESFTADDVANQLNSDTEDDGSEELFTRYR